MRFPFLKENNEIAEIQQNRMPAIIEAVANYAAVEEICVALPDVYKIYEEPAF